MDASAVEFTCRPDFLGGLLECWIQRRGAEGACRDTLRDDRAAAHTMVVGRGNYRDDAGNTVS